MTDQYYGEVYCENGREYQTNIPVNTIPINIIQIEIKKKKDISNIVKED